MNSTPRTAAKYSEIFAEDDYEAVEKMNEFAQQLERELNEAMERIKRLEEAGDRMFASCQWSAQRDAWKKAKEAKP